MVRRLKEHPAVALARSNRDLYVLLITLATLFILIFGYSVFRLLRAMNTSRDIDKLNIVVREVGEWIVYGVMFIIILTVIMVFIRLQRQIYLSNALNVRYSNLSWLKEWADNMANDINAPPVEIFIVQQPFLNASAFGFMKPYCIILFSETVERLSQDELKAIVCHEFAHIVYRHTNISTYLAPFSIIPLIGPSMGWFFGFWGRRAELTADRLAVSYLRNPQVIFSALLKIHMGADIAKYSSVEGMWHQLSESYNQLNRVAESMGSHPFLVRRVLNIYNFSKEQNISWQLPPHPGSDAVK